MAQEEKPAQDFQGTKLYAHLGVEPKTLEDYLEQMSIHFLKGSNGDFEASIKIGADDSPSRVDFSE